MRSLSDPLKRPHLMAIPHPRRPLSKKDRLRHIAQRLADAMTDEAAGVTTIAAQPGGANPETLAQAHINAALAWGLVRWQGPRLYATPQGRAALAIWENAHAL